MRSIRRDGLPRTRTSQQTSEYAQCLQIRYDLLHPHRSDMHLREGGSHIGVSLIGTNHDLARRGDGEVSARHRHVGMQEFLTQMSFLALCAFINRLGLEASSGYGVACKIVSFAMLVPSSLMQSMASFVSQNVGAGKEDRARKAMLTGMGIGLSVGVVVFIGVWFFGDKLTSIFTTDAAVIQRGFEYLRGFAPETILTAVLFSMIGYFNGHEKSLWVMIQGLIQTLLVRLPLAYYMSIQPDASLTNIGLAAPIATCAGIVLNVIFYMAMSENKKKAKEQKA